jgi:RHS repeat-associated protein
LHPICRSKIFGYDNLDRLTSANISGGTSFSASYSGNGNINSKTDAGTYSYHGTKFNDAVGATNPGNMIPSIQQEITYTAFQQPGKITEGQYELNYTYGADYNRIKSELKQNSNTIRTRYYFSDYEKDNTGKYIQYVSSPVGLIAIVENNSTIHYTYTDHLGSIVAATNSGGVIEVEQNFDAWGRRRDPNSWALQAPTATTSLPDWLYRGYTGHEHLDQFGLINMNGRLYDPVLGRVLSPDNYVQNAYGTQDYNRYTYAHNNPLLYNDPDGNNPLISTVIGGFIGGIINGLKYDLRGDDFLQGFWRGAISGALAGLTGYYAPIGFGAGAIYGAGNGAVIGAINAGLNGGDMWRGAGIGALMGGMIGGISGGIEASRLEANFWTGARPDHYMLAAGNMVAGASPATYSNEYLAKFKNANFGDVDGVSGMNMKYRPSDIRQNGDFFVNKKGEDIFAVTRYSIWKHGASSKIYFAKAAFSSKEQLSVVMTHELGYVVLAQNPALYRLAKTETGSDGLLETYGHQAIQTMTRDLILKNNWNIYRIGGQVTDFGGFQAEASLLNSISKLVREIKFP